MRSRIWRAAGAAFGAVLMAAVAAGPALAQAPPNTSANDKKIHEQVRVQFAITINPADRATLRESVPVRQNALHRLAKTRHRGAHAERLHVPQRPGRRILVQRRHHRQGRQCRAAGRAKEAPAVIVVVDTQPPQINLAPGRRPPAKSACAGALQDANPDYQGLKIAFQGADQSWSAWIRIPAAWHLPSARAECHARQRPGHRQGPGPQYSPPRIVRSRT